MLKKLSFFTIIMMHTGIVMAWETAWLEQEPGYEGKTIGTKIESVDAISDGEYSKQIVVSIPKGEVDRLADSQEIIVEGKPAPREIRQLEVEYEWSDDYENDRYGIIIKLKKGKNMPIRLYLKTESAIE